MGLFIFTMQDDPLNLKYSTSDPSQLNGRIAMVDLGDHFPDIEKLASMPNGLSQINGIIQCARWVWDRDLDVRQGQHVCRVMIVGEDPHPDGMYRNVEGGDEPCGKIG